MAVVGGNEFEHEVAARTEPHGEGPTRTAVGLQEQFRLVGPVVRGPRGIAVGGPVQRVRAAPLCQFGAARGVPEVAVQVETETPVGVGVWMVLGCAVPRFFPERQGHPLACVRPGRRRPHDELRCRSARDAVAGK